MSEMFNKVASRGYPGLLAEIDGAYPVAVSIAPGEGTLQPGTLIYKDTTGLYKAAATANITTNSYLAVIDEPAETGSTTTGEGTVVRAYLKGTFLKDKVLFKAGTTLTQAIAATLRLQGIILKDYINEQGTPSGTLDNVI